MQIDFEHFLNLTSCAFIEFQSILGSTNFDYIHTAIESIQNAILLLIALISDNISSPIDFTEFQLSLLKGFLVINAITVVLIAYYWNKYGGVITSRFVLPSECVEQLLLGNMSNFFFFC